MKNWELVFKSLANINRLKIIKMLDVKKSGMNVSEISEKLDISFRATSRHLIQLKNVGVLDSLGKDGNVIYTINKDLPPNFKQVFTHILS